MIQFFVTVLTACMTLYAAFGGDSSFGPSPSRVPSGVTSTVTLTAMPYARTVTCSDYTVTGTFTGAAPTTWTASPSGDSGACVDTGGGTFSCVVNVDPNAAGEGVETITIGDKTVTIGFYVDGEHSCFLSQSIDNLYNSSFSDLDPVDTWANLGSSALDVTQGTGSAQPTFRTSIVGGNPVVRCDGGDLLGASTAANWSFLSDGTDFTVEDVRNQTTANPANYQMIVGTQATCGAGIGLCEYYDDRTTDNDRAGALIGGGGTILTLESANDATPQQRFSLVQNVLDDDGGAGVDLSQFCNGSACGTAARSGAFTSPPARPLTVCGEFTGSADFTGDLFRVLIYQSALTTTQRGINEAVDEWALGGSLPVTPLAINALPYSRTTASGSYTLTGTAKASGAVSWSASPSGASGSCSGTSSWSCVVSITPDAVGEGVETITVSQVGGDSQQVTLGFYVPGHTVLHAQNANGLYNSGLSSGNTIATWENVGTSALDLTQSTAGARPTFTTNVVGGQPILRFDGSDEMVAATAADWVFAADGTGSTLEIVYRQTATNPNNFQVLMSTQGGSCGGANGLCAYYEDRAVVPANERNDVNVFNGGTIGYLTGTNDTVPEDRFVLNQITLENIVGDDLVQVTSGSANGAVAITGTYPTTSTAAFRVGGNSAAFLTGDIWRVHVYDDVLTSTQRAINEAVDEWALGASFPVTP